MARIVISSEGLDLDAMASPLFGRCPAYIFVDPDTLDREAVENPALNATGGAGIQAAQFVLGHGIQALVTNNVGPNAFAVLEAAGVAIYRLNGGTVRQAIAAYQAGSLPQLRGATQPEHGGGGSGRHRDPAPDAGR